MFNFSEQIRFQFIANAALMVDIFFTIRYLNYSQPTTNPELNNIIILFPTFSGFLVTYNFLRNEARMIEIQHNDLYKNIKLFGKLLMHRYIR